MDPLAVSPAGFWSRSPNRARDGQHVGWRNAIDGPAAEDRESIAL